ncbi:MAG: carbon monoxide dehydrogenase [Polaromonas sp. 39-63-203]|jgi:carbon monoxide dehydrogenase subunit G|uniref:CoxG family protein n=1 Tax=Polaromonas sp. TaxID=1869339 RepID=UPI000BC40D26|nr:SRPBCC family protein [Polaromonas sp.]OYY53540.1 MAG: carbon monoxide dehydrogenase [Polaromonas sp. 35-63-240]OYZ84571.1 MAG: carbon monoxide dehydrogenase [Polaromonas sp. 24-62-144]OZB00496.1 MAG: carbon monoxide dehydrogenase [Polaromonas sp. 39-63-203]HQS31430.1 SRPBCC family protein [Polaromonas sp.]HQS90764.1 SRPBCC family protein [Polaromonas sp.]
MEVKLDKQYPLDVDAVRAWALLTDLKAVASCMPGAEITEQISETSYKGGVKVKVGPAVAQFGGTVDVIEAVAAERKMVLRGKGADKGGSSASMDLTAIITADPANPAHCVLNGQAAVIVNGKFAQFGGRMMVQVSDMLLAQFVENFRQTALTLPPPEGSAAALAAASSGAAGSGAANAGASGAAKPAPAMATPVVAREINGLAIVWALLKSWLGGMFGKRS